MTRLKISLLIILNIILLPVYFLFFILIFFASFLPLHPTRTAKSNLKEFLGIRNFILHFYVTSLYMNYFFYFIEAYFFDFLKINHCSMIKESVSLEILFEEAKKIYPQAKQFNFVFILSHMANVEMYAFPVVRALKKSKNYRQKKLYALAKPSRFRFATKLMEWYRLRSHLGVIWTNNSILREMIDIIDNGNSVCLLVDQKPKKDGLFLKFFGKFAAFPTSGLKICMNKNMIVVYAAAHRVIPGLIRLKLQTGKNVHFSEQISSHIKYIKNEELVQAEIFDFENIPERNKLVSLEMSYFADWIEKEIKKKPTQWSWDYQKWSRQIKPIK